MGPAPGPGFDLWTPAPGPRAREFKPYGVNRGLWARCPASLNPQHHNASSSTPQNICAGSIVWRTNQTRRGRDWSLPAALCGPHGALVLRDSREAVNIFPSNVCGEWGWRLEQPELGQLENENSAVVSSANSGSGERRAVLRRQSFNYSTFFKIEQNNETTCMHRLCILSEGRGRSPQLHMDTPKNQFSNITEREVPH